MDHVPLLRELAIIAVLAVIVAVAFARLRIPTVAGLLVAGAIAGPYGTGLVRSSEAIHDVAEVGVVLLLFSIGLEFSLARMRDVFRQAAIGGAIQVGLTAVVVGAIATAAGEPLGRAVFWGFVFALSSTAIILRALADRRELDAPHGRFIVATLIFQDVCVVPMVLIVPLLAPDHSGGSAALDIARALGLAAVVVVATLGLARWLVPRALAWVAASRSREVFLLAILAIGIGTAWLTSLAGLSLALGAFLGGMVVADTEHGHRAIGDVIPLRDAFVSVFFVSLGMLFDPRVIVDEPVLVGTLVAGFVVLKGVTATIAALAIRFPARVAWLAGAGLAQFGEFGFVLTELGASEGVIDTATVRPLLAAGILSMFLAPLLVRVAPHVRAGERLLAPLERRIGVRSVDEADEAGPLSGHVVIVGAGLAGRSAAQALAACDVSCVLLELNARIVREVREDGIPIYYGDATSEEALRHAGLPEARLFVILIDDPSATERVVETAHRVAPGVPVLMRARYLHEVEPLSALGASDVVAEEVEGAIEVIARMLRAVDVSRNLIEEQLRAVRVRTQPTHRRPSIRREALADRGDLAGLKIENVLVRAGSRAAGASPASLALRGDTGALIVAIRRGERLIAGPDAAEALEVGDVVFLVGAEEAVARALAVFDPGAADG
jgi:monovalent cation:H+ antiporter-2, CPA2 family